MKCERVGYSLYSVTAFDLPYLAAILRLTLAGITWSSPPPMKSSGARSSFAQSTLNGVRGLRLAIAPWNRTLAAAGIAYRSHASRDCSSVSVLPNAYLKCFSLNGTALLMLSGLASTCSDERSVETGRSGMPRTVAPSIETVAAPRPRSLRICEKAPPNEWPMMIGGPSSPRMIFS